MKADAKREQTNTAQLVGADAAVGCQISAVKGAGCGLGVFESMLALAALVLAGAHMLAQEGTHANLPGKSIGGFVAQRNIGGVACGVGGHTALFAYQKIVHTQAKLGEGGEDFGELVAIVDTSVNGDIEIVRLLARGCGVSVAVAAADGVPVEVGMQIGRHFAKTDVETKADTVADTHTHDGIFTNMILCHGNEVVIGGKIGCRYVAIEKNGLLEVCKLCLGVNSYYRQKHSNTQCFGF